MPGRITCTGWKLTVKSCIESIPLSKSVNVPPSQVQVIQKPSDKISTAIGQGATIQSTGWYIR